MVPILMNIKSSAPYIKKPRWSRFNHGGRFNPPPPPPISTEEKAFYDHIDDLAGQSRTWATAKEDST